MLECSGLMTISRNYFVGLVLYQRMNLKHFLLNVFVNAENGLCYRWLYSNEAHLFYAVPFV